MKLEDHIFRLLAGSGRAEVPGFGTFNLENAEARLDEASGSILPPAQAVAFVADYGLAADAFVQALAAAEQIPVAEAAETIAKTTDYWKNSLSRKQDLHLEKLGTFRQDGEHFSFRGERIAAESPDFFGLEKISIPKFQQVESGSFSLFSPWLYLLLIPVAGIIVLALARSEMIFGKKSFKEKPSAPAHQVAKQAAPSKPDSLKKDTLGSPAKDSSIKIPAAKHPAKTYTHPYKWHKPKRRHNR